MDWEKVYRDLKKLNWFSLFIMSLVSYFLLSSSFTLGIILGGFIIMANFKVLQHTIRRGFSAQGVMNASKVFIILKYYLRLLVLGANKGFPIGFVKNKSSPARIRTWVLRSRA